MSNRLRSLDSKISFFAFADIITAVSGVLIFVALLLATDLGLPTNNKVPAITSDLEQQIQEVLAQQVEVDAQNQRLQELLSTANTSPDPEKLQADIKRLKAQLAEEQKKQAALLSQMSQSQAAMAQRDAELGLTALKDQIEKEHAATREIAAQEANVKAKAAALNQHLAGLQSKLLQLRQREGKLWLIPEKGTTAKEPILAIVSQHGVSLERFDHPETTKQLDGSHARTDFDNYAKTLKPDDEYIVFLVRPSGIALFQDLVKTARDRNIEVGYDAIEEDKDIYFMSPPVLDESVPVNSAADYTSGNGGYSDPAGSGTPSGSNDHGGEENSGNLGKSTGHASGKTGAANGRGSSGPNSGSTGSAPNGHTTTGKSDAATTGANGTSTGSASDSASQSSNSSTTEASKTGAGGAHSGTGSPGSESGKKPDNAQNKSDVGSSNTPASAKKADSKTNSIPAPKPPTPAAKSWWQRFLDWLLSFFK